MLLSSLRALRSCAQQRSQINCGTALAAALHSVGSSDGGSGSPPPGADASLRPATDTAAAPPAGPAQERGQQEEIPQVISIDRSALFNPQPHSHDPAVLAAQAAAAGIDKEPETDLVRHLKALIQVRKMHRSDLWIVSAGVGC